MFISALSYAQNDTVGVDSHEEFRWKSKINSNIDSVKVYTSSGPINEKHLMLKNHRNNTSRLDFYLPRDTVWTEFYYEGLLVKTIVIDFSKAAPRRIISNLTDIYKPDTWVTIKKMKEPKIRALRDEDKKFFRNYSERLR